MDLSLENDITCLNRVYVGNYSNYAHGVYNISRCETPYHTYPLIDAHTFMHNGGRVLSCHAYLLVPSRHILDAS